LNLADAVICVSNFTRKRLKEVYGISDAHVIHNGIDTSVFKPKVPGNPPRIPEGKTVIFFAGNLSKRKGGDLLPPIMEQLGDRFVLLLATTNDSQKLTPCRTIQNLGNLTPAQLVDTYNRCDIFLSASRLEGFGLSVAEAMACGKPVVATNCSSLPELVVDGKGGFL
jgi:glycosyltransferase involved in cell wall biosynthesis